MSRGVGRIQRHMEHIANTIEAMLDLLEIIQNLPAARNRDLVALSLLRVMAAARKLLAHVHARGRHTRHGLRENGGGRSRAARHARRGRTRLKIRFEVEHEHEREE